MSEATWWRHLRGDPTGFLLDGEEPGVVWRTLVELLARPADSPAVVRARAQARAAGAVPGLLAGQQPLGYWGSPHGYGARWGGTAWQIMALAALGLNTSVASIVRVGPKHLAVVICTTLVVFTLPLAWLILAR